LGSAGIARVVDGKIFDGCLARSGILEYWLFQNAILIDEEVELIFCLFVWLEMTMDLSMREHTAWHPAGIMCLAYVIFPMVTIQLMEPLL
jgi:hypothetical protein